MKICGNICYDFLFRCILTNNLLKIIFVNGSQYKDNNNDKFEKMERWILILVTVMNSKMKNITVL